MRLKRVTETEQTIKYECCVSRNHFCVSNLIVCLNGMHKWQEKKSSFLLINLIDISPGVCAQESYAQSASQSQVPL